MVQSIDSFALSWLTSTAKEEEEGEVELSVGTGLKGKATPRTNGAMLSVTLRPESKQNRVFNVRMRNQIVKNKNGQLINVCSYGF